MSRPPQLDPTRTRHVIERRPGTDPTSRPAAELDPERLCAAVARAVLEVEVGRRPLHQLESVLSPAVVARLAVRDDRARRAARVLGRPIVGPGSTVVVKVLSQRPTGDACEAVVLVRHGRRVVAVAMRAERYRGHWRITELARPEDHTPGTCDAPVPTCGTGA